MNPSFKDVVNYIIDQMNKEPRFANMQEYYNEFNKRLLVALNLPDVVASLPTKKEKIIEDAYFLNLQNLSGREDFEEAFKIGIETGVNDTIEYLNEK